MVWRSLAADGRVSCKSPLGARLNAIYEGRWSQPEKRHGRAAEVLRIIRHRKNPVRGFLESIPVPPIF
jgi:hypothetical protein